MPFTIDGLRKEIGQLQEQWAKDHHVWTNRSKEKDKEIERLRKFNQTQADINERSNIVIGNKNKEIERLRNGIQLALDKFAKRHRESGLEILQEALKEE